MRNIMDSNTKSICLLLLCLWLCACAATPDTLAPAIDLDTETDTSTLPQKARMTYINELARPISVFDEVAIGLGLPLRQYLCNSLAVEGKKILDLGAGTGVLSLIALEHGAELAVATDINPNAVANAIHNAKQSKLEHKMDVRLVSTSNPGAYSVIAPHEKFDLIVSNPPQRQVAPQNLYEFSYNDPDLSFLRSIVEGMEHHLTPDGKGVLALYNHSLELVKQIAKENGLEVKIHLKTRNQFGDYHVVEISHRQA